MKSDPFAKMFHPTLGSISAEIDLKNESVAPETAPATKTSHSVYLLMQTQSIIVMTVGGDNKSGPKWTKRRIWRWPIRYDFHFQSHQIHFLGHNKEIFSFFTFWRWLPRFKQGPDVEREWESWPSWMAISHESIGSLQTISVSISSAVLHLLHTDRLVSLYRSIALWMPYKIFFDCNFIWWSVRSQIWIKQPSVCLVRRSSDDLTLHLKLKTLIQSKLT